MLDWSDLALLLAVARHGSFGSAARKLGVATPTVGRRIGALERALGLRLLERHPQGARLNAEGARVVALAERTEESVAALARLAASLRADHGPPIRISAPETVIADTLAPALPQLFAADPEVRVDLSASAAIVSLARGEADIAVRLVRPVDSGSIARRLPAVRLGLFASRAYLAGRRPQALVLERERMLGYDDSYGPIAERVWMRDAGLEAAVAVRCSSVRGLTAAALSAVGIALLPSVPSMRAGLVEIPAPRAIPARAPWLVMHAQARAWPALRTVVAWVVASFQSLARDEPEHARRARSRTRTRR